MRRSCQGQGRATRLLKRNFDVLEMVFDHLTGPGESYQGQEESCQGQEESCQGQGKAARDSRLSWESCQGGQTFTP